MTATIPIQDDQAVFYPYKNGEPLAQSYDHLLAIFKILSDEKLLVADALSSALTQETEV